MTDFQIVEKDKDSLYIGNIRTVEFDLTLPLKGENGSDIIWKSGHDRIISVEGKVTRPRYGTGSRTVPLTATIRHGEAETKKTFEVRVLEEENKIQVKKVFPIHLQAQSKEQFFLPTASAIETTGGRTIAHLIEWKNNGERIYTQCGTVIEQGYIAGTKIPVEAVVEVVSVSEKEIKESVPIVTELSGNVRLEGKSYFLNAQNWSEEFLLNVNDDQMLYNFREAAGLDTKAAPEMIGWDAPDSNLKGHTTGHYLSGLALCYRTGRNEKIREKAKYMCDALKECQDSFGNQEGFHKGFLSGYDESQFDLLEKFVRYPEIWAPYYTLHKIFAGLLDCYEYAEIETALVVACRLGTWVYNRLSVLSHHVLMKMWSLYIAGEFGGMNEVMARLYEITGNETHLKAAQFFDNDKLFFPLSQKVDALDTMHANQHIPQIIGCMKLYEATGEKRYYDIAEYFWSIATKSHTYVIGGIGEGEMFHAANEIGSVLTKNTAESCASYNMLKLTKELYKYCPTSSYMDYYERTMFNHIISSCDHAPTGASTYFMPLAPGFRKEFDDENSCCHGTGLENHFKYTEAIYFKDDVAIYINLFVPSVLEENEIHIIQFETVENPGCVKLKVQGCGKYALKVRVPYWSLGKYDVFVNGTETAVEKSQSGYITIIHDWSEVTEVEIHFTCELRIERTPDIKDTAALLYGPYVLAALTKQADYLELAISEENVKNEVKRSSGLSFLFKEITFVPLCSICDEMYQVYFKTKLY